MTVSLEDQIKAVRREIALRRAVYAKRVASGHMKREDAGREIAVMEAVHGTLVGLRRQLGMVFPAQKEEAHG